MGAALSGLVEGMTKSLIAFQSGGYLYARKVSGGVWATTAAVWLGYSVGCLGGCGRIS